MEHPHLARLTRLRMAQATLVERAVQARVFGGQCWNRPPTARPDLCCTPGQTRSWPRAREGAVHDVAGLGWKFGDPGSGFDLGRRAIAVGVSGRTLASEPAAHVLRSLADTLNWPVEPRFTMTSRIEGVRRLLVKA